MVLGLVAMACAFGIAAADDSDAATLNLYPAGDDFGKVSTTLTYTLDYSVGETSQYKASLIDGDGKSVGSVSPSSGSLYTSSSSRSFTITLPEDAGDYRLRVTVTEGGVDIERTAAVKAVDPIVLSATIENDGHASRTFMVYVYIKDGDSWTKLENSGKEITVPAKGSYNFTYDYIVKDVRTTTFCLKAEEGSLGEEIKGLGEENAHTFYTSAADFTVLEWICVGGLVIAGIFFIYVYRKPIKNRGKPKGRR